MTDHEVTLQDGPPLHRPGRFSRFFQYLSLFCFSMLGLVIAGNVAMVFVFWELVGICSYFLIGFYIERKSASNAANKAFIVNRVGDFGMIIGLMALWAGLGTFSFGDADQNANGTIEPSEPGIFSQVRPASRDHALDHARRHGPGGRTGRDLAVGSVASGGYEGRHRGPCLAGKWTICATEVPMDPAGITATGCWSSPAWASSAAAWARAPSSRCTSGCPTRWKAPRPCRPWSTRRRWSPPASTWSAGSIRCSRPRCCW